MDFSRLSRLKGKHSGKDAFLMCNGPSLNRVDFSSLDLGQFVLFGLNKIHLGINLGIPLPHYTIAVNKKVIIHLTQDPTFQFNTVIFSHRAGQVLPESDEVFYINTNPHNLPRFSLDCHVGVHEGWTVTHAALQIIFYMGIRRCVIVGLDHNFSTDPTRANETETKVGEDLDHFVPHYFSDGQDWDLPDLENSELSYRSARLMFEKVGGLILDATAGGKCDVFLKSSLADAFSILQR